MLQVSYRIGENGSICILYEYKENVPPAPWRPAAATPTSTTAPAKSNSSVSSSPVKQLTQQVSNQLPKSTPSSPKHSGNNLNNTVNNLNQLNSSKAAACKDSLYKIDFLIDPRKSASISEHLAAYVSS